MVPLVHSRRACERIADRAREIFDDSFLSLPFHHHQRVFICTSHIIELRRGGMSYLDRGVDAALGRVEREDVVAVVNVQRGVLSKRTELPS